MTSSSQSTPKRAIELHLEDWATLVFVIVEQLDDWGREIGVDDDDPLRKKLR